jgi:hypothetical protein
MAARLSTLRVGSPLSPVFFFLRFLVLTSVGGWVDLRVIYNAAGRIRQIRKIHLIGTQFRDLPVCSIVPQPLRYSLQIWIRYKLLAKISTYISWWKISQQTKKNSIWWIHLEQRPRHSSSCYSLASHRGGPDSTPGLVMWDLWWTKWRWGRFSPSTSVSLANLFSTNFSIITITYHMGLVQ